MTIKEIASNLLQSEHNNGFGIRCHAITKACEENHVEFKDVMEEIIKQGNIEDDNY